VNYSVVKYTIFKKIINNLLPTDISNQNILFTILYFYSYEKITFGLLILILITNVSKIKLSYYKYMLNSVLRLNRHSNWIIFLIICLLKHNKNALYTINYIFFFICIIIILII